ncbi:hypothetical protein [Actinoplanes subtropicus]|uniref:hypothetical protein n=1 Tax=Actinoplanes subtropicus TaxID=543632 RepID=UPI0004C2B86A|nr:hypothetical protein [Actinoplanes subtropicus]
MLRACEVDEELAHRIGGDLLQRAEASAVLPQREQDVLIAPFVEEVFDHKPVDSSLDVRPRSTSSCVTVCSSGRITTVRCATASSRSPSTLPARCLISLPSRRRQPISYHGPNPFAGLAGRYPRAWACLDALTDTFSGGGRGALRLPAAPMPELPGGEEVVAAAAGDDGRTVFSAIDPRFDRVLLDLLEQAAAEEVLLCTSALSRYSRNSEKLHRILEFLLAHDATILTTNYLIGPKDVWGRRGDLVKPDSQRPYAGALDPRGLTGTHRKIAESAARRALTSRPSTQPVGVASA